MRPQAPERLLVILPFPPLHKPFMSFTLNNLLLVPSITKNLINVGQFLRDYNVYFQFTTNECLI
jgi:hypothetical protein